jgi:hypothetical protein
MAEIGFVVAQFATIAADALLVASQHMAIAAERLFVGSQFRSIGRQLGRVAAGPIGAQLLTVAGHGLLIALDLGEFVVHHLLILLEIGFVVADVFAVVTHVAMVVMQIVLLVSLSRRQAAVVAMIAVVPATGMWATR